MCHSANSMMTWPMLGATTGMIMNTMKTSDMTSAIARPPNVSRTIETVMTRVAAAPTPWMKRRMRSASKVGAKAAAKAATT